MDSSLFEMGKPDHIQNGQENAQLCPDMPEYYCILKIIFRKTMKMCNSGTWPGRASGQKEDLVMMDAANYWEACASCIM